jgi:hypothetical protein
MKSCLTWQTEILTWQTSRCSFNVGLIAIIRSILINDHIYKPVVANNIFWVKSGFLEGRKKEFSFTEFYFGPPAKTVPTVYLFSLVSC